MLKLKSISPSRIKTFDLCKFKYWLTYHCPDIILKSNWGAVHGSLLHDVLENYASEVDLDWMSRLYRGYAGELEIVDRDDSIILFDSPLMLAKAKDYKDKKPYCDTCPYASQKKGICSISKKPLDSLPGCPRDLFDESVSMIDNIIKRYENTWSRILRNSDNQLIGTEYKFNASINGTDVVMNGIMDLVIEEDKDTIHVIDYKAGAWTQDYNECRNDIQVQMYSLAARKEFIEDIHNHGYKYKNIILTFDYFRKQPITLAFTQEEDITTEAFVLNKIREIESTEWIYRIVPNNVDFEARTSNNGFKYFKCKTICDTAVCSKHWKGKLSTDEN